MNFFDYLLPFLLLLGVLIFFHELGHFAVAKWCGVKVEKFSLGFGPALLQKRVGETTYVISALPLGGFVKMLGELPGETLLPEERARAFNFKPPWQRIAIALAGPGMNLLLPVFLIAAAAMVGMPEPTARIGGIEPEGSAARAGLLPGDRVVAIDGQPVEWWGELAEALAASDSRNVRLEVERAGEHHLIELARESQDDGFAPVGIKPSAPAAVVVVSAESLAASAGLESGDRIVRMGGAEVGDRFALEAQLPSLSAPVEIEVRRPGAGGEETRLVTLRELPAERTLDALGLASLDFQVVAVNPLTPASSAGIQAGDIPLAVDDRPMRSAAQLVETIRASGGRKLALELLRADEKVLIHVEAQRQPVPDSEGGVETHYALGVSLGAPLVGGEMRERAQANPLAALAFGARYTVDVTVATAQAFGELFRGRVGLNSLAGPIGIGAVAADKFRSSWVEFVGLMVLISINLALLNLLPIPVLDGGTIVLTCAEWLKGGPLPLRARDWAQTVGLSFILLLMGVAFWNDLWRIVRSLG